MPASGPVHVPDLRVVELGPGVLEVELEREFAAARERGNEGLMVKDPRSPYRPGRRGMEWLKIKRPLRSLDVVVTAVEWGHGKRRGVLSDYTFAVRDEAGRLRNIGQASSGLTDRETAILAALAPGPPRFQHHGGAVGTGGDLAAEHPGATAGDLQAVVGAADGEPVEDD